MPPRTPARRAHLALIPSLCTSALLGTWLRFTSWRPYHLQPFCPIHRYTGLLCPGCGATHALAALLHGRLLEALHRNPLVLALLPLAVLYAALAYSRALTGRSPTWPTLPRPALIALYCLTAGFTIARNLP